MSMRTTNAQMTNVEIWTSVLYAPIFQVFELHNRVFLPVGFFHDVFSLSVPLEPWREASYRAKISSCGKASVGSCLIEREREIERERKRDPLHIMLIKSSLSS